MKVLPFRFSGNFFNKIINAFLLVMCVELFVYAIVSFVVLMLWLV